MNWEAIYLVVMLVVSNGEHRYYTVHETPDLQECENIAEFLEYTAVPKIKDDSIVQFLCSQGPVP